MASKRMFTMKICDSDAFLDMPLSTQCLYFHLNMRADDDGFIDNPKRIMRVVGATEDDLRILIAKHFLLTFENGVIVIKHWRMHNTLSNARYHETQYLEEKATLLLKENGSYSFNSGKPLDDSHLVEIFKAEDKRRTSGGQAEDADIDLDIDKELDKDLDLDKGKGLGKEKEKRHKAVYFPNDELLNDAFTEFVEMRKKIKAPMTERAIDLTIKKLSGMGDVDTQIKILNQSVERSWRGIFPLKDAKEKETDWDNI